MRRDTAAPATCTSISRRRRPARRHRRTATYAGYSMGGRLLPPPRPRPPGPRRAARPRERHAGHRGRRRARRPPGRRREASPRPGRASHPGDLSPPHGAVPTRRRRAPEKAFRHKSRGRAPSHSARRRCRCRTSPTRRRAARRGSPRRHRPRRAQGSHHRIGPPRRDDGDSCRWGRPDHGRVSHRLQRRRVSLPDRRSLRPLQRHRAHRGLIRTQRAASTQPPREPTVEPRAPHRRGHPGPQRHPRPRVLPAQTSRRQDQAKKRCAR